MINLLKEEITNIPIPVELHNRSKLGVQKAKTEMEGKVKKYVRKRIVSALLAACLILPTGAFAYQTLLADEYYGSFENLKKHIGSATMETYFLLDAKLTHAKGDMTKEGYAEFKELLSVITTSKVEYGDQYGNIDYSQVPPKQLGEIREVLFEIQPYFDQLNNQISSKEIQTAEQYEAYINAIMTYETIMAQSGIKESDQIDKVPSNLKEEFIQARDYLRWVNDQQLKH